MKYILVLVFITLFTFGYGENCYKCELLLRQILSKIADTEEGPFFQLVQINTIAGLRTPGDVNVNYSVNADLLDKTDKVKTCDVGITGKPRVKNGYFVSFWCDGEHILLRRLS